MPRLKWIAPLGLLGVAVVGAVHARDPEVEAPAEEGDRSAITPS